MRKTSLLKKTACLQPFYKKRLDRKFRHSNNKVVGVITTLLKKILTENPEKRLSLKILSPNPIGVINRRNG
ncbi:CBS domain-containing protein [Methanosarcina barkeri]|uniref:hypothetical protein n=1 Tax=Methanosarcina barkeri TaxID=2208 RepID=UPI0006D25E1C|nr:hypothetical protein [Methanosarcina barkeri]